MTETLSRLHVADPLLEANLCDGTRVLAIALTVDDFWGPHRYDACPGCVGCDYDTVSARQAAKPPVDVFARFPCDVDDEF